MNTSRYKPKRRNDIYKTPPSPYDTRKRNKKQNNVKRKKAFILQDGLCYYCGKKTYHVDDIAFYGPEEGLIPTAEHLYSKWDIRRAISRKIVMACQNCNHDQGLMVLDAVWDGYDYNDKDTPITDLIKEYKCKKPLQSKKSENIFRAKIALVMLCITSMLKTLSKPTLLKWLLGKYGLK